MATPDSLFETLKDWLAAGNPGLVTREDLNRVESRVDELLELMDEIEERLEERLNTPQLAQAPEAAQQTHVSQTPAQTKSKRSKSST